jgi:hypothetical protein
MKESPIGDELRSGLAGLTCDYRATHSSPAWVWKKGDAVGECEAGGCCLWDRLGSPLAGSKPVAV